METSALPPDAVEVARVLGAWGVKGGLKVKPFAADPQALFSSKRWYLQAAPGALPGAGGGLPAAAGGPWLARVVQAREQGDTVVAVIEGLTDRDQAQALKGAGVWVARSSFPTPQDDEFYWVDLIGLAVFNREGVALGEIVGLIETGPHCVLRVQPAADAAATRPAETLIPFVSAYVDAVDLAARRVLVDWAPGD